MIKQYPVNYISITQGYSQKHQAIDLGWKDNPNQPIYSCSDGYVERIYYFNDGGNVVRIKYDDGTSSEFMHLKDNSIIVKEKQRVSRGQRVATMGATGLVTGPHLHLIMRDKNGNRQNPIDVLYAYPNQIVNEKQKYKILRYNGNDNSDENRNDNEYIVKKGDTLSYIANLYNINYKTLAEFNNIKDVNLIYPGQIIKIPTINMEYIVKKGDTLTSIAKKYNTTWQVIYENNKDVIGKNPNIIRPGQKLII